MSLLQYGMMTWPEVVASDRDQAVVLLPMGSVEQHGYHGPLTTDSILSQHLCKPLADAVPEFTWLELPPLVYGYAKQSAAFPGTISVEGTTFSSLVRDVLQGMFRQGFRKVVMLNSHLENGDFAIEGAAQALEKTPDARVLLLMWWEFVPDGVVEEVFGNRWPRAILRGHGGFTETSLMLNFVPELVHIDRAPDKDSPPSVHRFRVLPWEATSFGESGSTLRAGGCSGEQGAQLLQHFVKGAAALIRDQFNTR